MCGRSVRFSSETERCIFRSLFLCCRITMSHFVGLAFRFPRTMLSNSNSSLASRTQESLLRKQQSDQSHKRLPDGEQWRKRKKEKLSLLGRRQRASRRGGALSECTVTIPMLFKFHSLAASATRLWGRLVLPGRLRHA